MKLIKFNICLILMLLNAFTIWCQTVNQSLPSTGEIIESDSIVCVPIQYIRTASEYIIERNYLTEIVIQQDSVVKYYKDYTKEQSIIIQDMQNRIVEGNKITEKLNKEYKKERAKTITLGVTTGGLAVAVITTILINCLK